MKSVALVLAFLGYAWALPNTSFTCDKVFVLHSVTRDGWNDGCLGLSEKENVLNSLSCQTQCHQDMNCSMWQWVAKGSKESCWSGSLAHGCQARGSNSSIAQFADQLKAGERIMHGTVIVKSNNTHETIGLHQYQEDTGTDAEKMARCKVQCETDTECTVWQYGETGCWFEHGPTNYATGTKTEAEGSTFAAKMLGGQTIEHVCPPDPVVPKPAEDPFPWLWVILGTLLGLAALAAIVYMLMQKPEKKVKKTRAVKIQPAPEPPAPEPQPVMANYYVVPQPNGSVVYVPEDPQMTPLMQPSLVMQ